MRGEIIEVDGMKGIIRIRLKNKAQVTALAREFGRDVDIQIKPVPEQKQQSMFAEESA